MDKATQDRMNKNFDICYIIGKECLAFTKYPALHEVELRHGVDLGQAYKTKDSVCSITDYGECPCMGKLSPVTLSFLTSSCVAILLTWHTCGQLQLYNSTQCYNKYILVVTVHLEYC